MNRTPKLLRSFLGAGLGAAGAIYPAATYDMALLLVPGGIAGWLIGYHGEAIVAGLMAVYALICGANADLDARVLALVDRARSFGRKLKRAGLRIMTVALAMLYAVGRFFKAVPGAVWAGVVACAQGVGQVAVRLYTMATHPDPHPMARAERARNWMLVAWSLLGLCLALWLTQDFTHGGRVAGTGKSARFVSDNEAFANNIVAGLFMFAIVFGAPLGMMKASAGSERGYWRKYKMLERLGLGGFLARELFHLVWIQAWWAAIVALCVGGAIGGIFLSILGGILTVGAGVVLFVAAHAFYLVAVADKDYGFGSLALGLFVGVGTFYLYHDALVSDPTFRLIVCTTAGFGAGGISLVATWLASSSVNEPKSMLNRMRNLDFKDPMDRLAGGADYATTIGWVLLKKLLPADTRLQAQV